MSIFWFILGVFVGMFIPGPYNEQIKNWVKTTWRRIFSKEKE